MNYKKKRKKKYRKRKKGIQIRSKKEKKLRLNLKIAQSCLLLSSGIQTGLISKISAQNVSPAKRKLSFIVGLPWQAEAI